MTARTASLRLVADLPAASPAHAAARSAPSRLGWAVAGLATVAALGGAWAHATGEERGIRRLPPPERAALYQRTLDTLRSVCAGGRRNDLRALCRGQAELALLFPECDGACRATARERLRTNPR